MRLTKYEPQENSMFPYQLQEDELRNKLTALHKLGQLEDIEEEYGIDLITLFKTLKQGAWFIDPRNNNKFFAMCTLCSDIDGKFECAQEEMKFHGFVVLDQLFGLGYELKDYSKTWALTKEDFE